MQQLMVFALLCGVAISGQTIFNRKPKTLEVVKRGDQITLKCSTNDNLVWTHCFWTHKSNDALTIYAENSGFISKNYPGYSHLIPAANAKECSLQIPHAIHVSDSGDWECRLINSESELNQERFYVAVYDEPDVAISIKPKDSWDLIEPRNELIVGVDYEIGCAIMMAKKKTYYGISAFVQFRNEKIGLNKTVDSEGLLGTTSELIIGNTYIYRPKLTDAEKISQTGPAKITCIVDELLEVEMNGLMEWKTMKTEVSYQIEAIIQTEFVSNSNKESKELLNTSNSSAGRFPNERQNIQELTVEDETTQENAGMSVPSPVVLGMITPLAVIGGIAIILLILYCSYRRNWCCFKPKSSIKNVVHNKIRKFDDFIKKSDDGYENVVKTTKPERLRKPAVATIRPLETRPIPLKIESFRSHIYEEIITFPKDDNSGSTDYLYDTLDFQRPRCNSSPQYQNSQIVFFERKNEIEIIRRRSSDGTLKKTWNESFV